MKKILSFVLALALLLSMCSITAFAADGDQPAPTTGPADSTFIYGGARCGIYDTHTYKSTNVVAYDYDLTEVAVHNDAIPGMTYDMESNTLTVKDVHQRDNQLYIWYMGNDFKLNVEGENEFGIIYVYNYFNFHSTSLNIIGTGTLTVNEQLINDDAIHMYADGEDPLMGLDIADSVTVHLYSNTPEGEEDPAPVVSLGRTVTAPAEGAITVGGKKLPEAKSEQFKVVDSDYVPAAKVEDPDEDIASGLQVRSKTDPDGVYSVGQMDGSYIVRRWIYLESLDIWTYDRSFADKGLVGKRYKKADFEAEYDYVTGMAPAHIDYMSVYTLEWRGTEGTKMTNDEDPGAIYLGVPTGGVWDWDDDYRGNYEIHRVVWDSNQEMYVEDTSFKAIDLMESKLEENGFHIVREEVYEPLKLTVWTTENPDDDGRFDITAPVMKRESDPEGIYVQIGTYGSDGKSEGVTVFKVHYNPVSEEHYVMYYDHDYNDTEFFLVPNADIENGTADFSYDGEMVTKQIHERFLSGNYNIDNDLTSAVQLKKTDEPDAVYAYRSWTHFHEDDTQEEMYGIMRLQYNEKLGCYVEDTDFDEVVTNDLGKLEYMGYEVILSEQPLEYYTKGRLNLSEYPAYTDQNGTAYYADYNDNVYSYSDDQTITIDGTTFYLGTYEPDIDVSDLNDTEHEIVTDTYKYWIDGPEYHHEGGAAPTGFTLSGKLDSYLYNDEYVTMTLENTEDDWQINYLAEGSDKTYEIPSVPAGTYKMTVSKKDHVTREYDVTVSGDTTQDVKICPIGDCDLNGKVQAADALKAYKHAQGKADEQLSGYAFDCADVPIGTQKPNGKVQAADAMNIYQQAQGKHNLF